MTSGLRIVVTRRWPEAVERELCEAFPDVVLNTLDEPLGESGLREALHTADVLLPSVSDRLGADLLSAAGVRTKFIGNYGVGFSHIDVDAARRSGIVVSNTPGVLTESTADLAILLMLMVARRAGEGERELRTGDWSGWRPTHLMGSDVTGKTLGVVGMGRIGTAVAMRAHYGFAMPVVWHGRGVANSCPVPGSVRLGTLDEVFAAADFVSVHVPGGPANRHLVGAAQLERMKPTAYLINTARGDVVDEEALSTALSEGWIAGAGLDVYQDEPRVPLGLRNLDNAVLLPHLGSATVETRVAMGRLVLANLLAWSDGREPPNRVA
jgi:lactate dehydrogenase-like 2-hydroxyacid dehydrogenase